MNPITVIWSMAASVCLALAAVHFFVWVNDRRRWESLLFCIAAVAGAVLTFQEQALMRAQTSAEIGEWLRWMHMSAAAIIIALVWFIRHYLKAGRLWFAWAITGFRVAVLIPNFVGFPNATFREMEAPTQISFLGEIASVPVGDANPWRILILISMVLLLIYVLDAAISAWRRGRKGSSVILGSAVLLTVILAATTSELMIRGLLPGPMIGLTLLPIILAMATQLSMDLVRVGQLSQSLLESQKRMNLASKAARLTNWEWDVVRDKLWSAEFGRKGAAEPEKASFARYLDRIHPADRERVREAIDTVLKEDKNFRVEFRLAGDNDDPRWIAAYGRTYRTASGEPCRILGVSMDITERKRVERAFERQRSELAHIQRVSTMGQLSATLAHELNQPLGAILRNAEAGELLIRQDPSGLKEPQEIFSDIQRDARRVAAIIERMRLLLTRRDLVFETIGIGEIIAAVISLVDAEFRARDATLKADVASDLPSVSGDWIQLQQVMLNLLLNSLDALEEQQGDRNVRIMASQLDNDTIVVSVSDSGAGIAPDQSPLLFEPFFTTKAEGTGIGLAISKTIIEAHGGRIWAANNDDCGATVTFTLPLSSQDGAA